MKNVSCYSSKFIICSLAVSSLIMAGAPNSFADTEVESPTIQKNSAGSISQKPSSASGSDFGAQAENSTNPIGGSTYETAATTPAKPSAAKGFKPAIQVQEVEKSSRENIVFAVRKNILSDDEIAEKCSSSISKKVAMVNYTNADGDTKKVPRCVQIYETMRDMAVRYEARQNQAQRDVASAVTGCENQATCLFAGNGVAQVAITSHTDLAGIANDAETQLSAIVRVNPSAQSTDKANKPISTQEMNGPEEHTNAAPSAPNPAVSKPGDITKVATNSTQNWK